MVDVPRQAPIVVPNASAIKTLPTLGRFPFLSSKLVFSATPITVPIVSNISTNRKENVIDKNSMRCFDNHGKLNLINVGAIEGGIKLEAEN